MTAFIRHTRVDKMDADTAGDFSMVLATEGEASDGHILSIAGGEVPERMPLLNSHFNSPSDALGSVILPTPDLAADPPVLRAFGSIELEGEGADADIRRDVALMINRGHISGVSIRWDGIKQTARVNLPEDHPFRVAEDATGPERHGLFFEQWRALEGSVVAVGADPQALIGRANETTGEVAQFWRSMAQDAQDDLVDQLAAVQTEARVHELEDQLKHDESVAYIRSERVHERIDELTQRIDALEQNQPTDLSDQRADLPEDPDADLRPEPTQRGVSLDQCRALIRESREEARAENVQLIADEVAAARGRVRRDRTDTDRGGPAVHGRRHEGAARRGP